ncbi:galactose oxidase early set domain-containing protein [Nocardia vinacea]|uniref:Galactose oxidase early set domain-containing protein n=1 Tax=Nocardia vinacea TaxID=96468 RepID=A0ABZ1Z8B3_9NOCA|nr:galactose oxidase early set domain-containing protein [Nocardia vinacea]
MRIETYWPPYLFQGERPGLALATDTVAYGAIVTATTTTALREVNLVRPGACTHSSDNEQRLIDLEFTSAAPDSVTLTLPSNPALAPPGWYLVFVVNDQGVPSTGQWLHLS